MIQRLMEMNLEGMTQTKARQKIAIISGHQAILGINLRQGSCQKMED